VPREASPGSSPEPTPQNLHPQRSLSTTITLLETDHQRKVAKTLDKPGQTTGPLTEDQP
jgi:hypothetical protein